MNTRNASAEAVEKSPLASSRCDSEAVSSSPAFLVFILLYVPCIATVVAIGSEAGWKWAAASVVYNTAMAWLVAWIVYRIVLLF